MDLDDAPPCQLRNLAKAAARNTYNDLKRMLELELPSAASEQRRQILLDFAARSRLLLARLLGATRWAATYGAAAASAGSVEERCIARTALLEDVTDDLWAARTRAANKSMLPTATAVAVDALADGNFYRFPQISSSAAGLPTRSLANRDGEIEGDTTTPAARVALATRRAIRDALPAIPRLSVLEWRVHPVCVRVGVKGLWTADLSLDGLDLKTARLRCHRISVLVAPDLDAGSKSHTLSREEQAMLCRLADDRMSAAVGLVPAGVQVDRAQIMLGSLCVLLTSEVCAPLVMAHLRCQAEKLKTGPWSDVLDIKGDASDSQRNTPIVISYWPKSRNKSSLTISEHQPKTPGNGDVCASQLVSITHEPPLPGCAGEQFSNFVYENTSSLNLEKMIEGCCKIRAGEQLLGIADAVLRRRSDLAVHPRCLTICTSWKSNQQRIEPLGTNVNFSAVGNECLIVHLHQDRCLGIEIRVSSRTGGLRVRPFGAAGLVEPSRKNSEGDSWPGDRHFENNLKEESTICSIIQTVRSAVKLDCAARAVCALDIGVSNTLPPGTASVAATAPAERSASQLVPPFAPLERRSPRRFLTLSPPPSIKDTVNGVNGSFVTALPKEHRNSLSREGPTSKRPRLTYATTSDALVFIQESSSLGSDTCSLERPQKRRRRGNTMRPGVGDMEDVDRYNGTAAAAAAWAVTRDVVERRLRRDSLLRAFVAANVASAAHTHHMKSGDDGALHLESASRVLLKVKCEPLPVRRAELLLRGSDSWQVRLSLLPPIFDSTDAALVRDAVQGDGGDGNLWTVGVACGGSQLTFTYPSANAASVRSFFRDLTRARTAAALARGVPPSLFYKVLRRSPVRIVVGVGPFHQPGEPNGVIQPTKHQYTATVEYVYSKGNSGGFSLTFSPTKPTMEMLAPLIEEALDASGGQVGGILAGLLERACPVAAAAESAVRERGNGRIRFVTALRVRAVFAGVEQGAAENVTEGAEKQRGQPPPGQVAHAVDVDARSGGGVVTVIDVGRATAVMIQQGFANRGGGGNSGGSGADGARASSGRRCDFVLVPKWDDTVAEFCKKGYAEAQRAGSTVVLRMSMLERFLTELVSSVRPPANTNAISTQGQQPNVQPPNAQQPNVAPPQPQ